MDLSAQAGADAAGPGAAGVPPGPAAGVSVPRGDPGPESPRAGGPLAGATGVGEALGGARPVARENPAGAGEMAPLGDAADVLASPYQDFDESDESGAEESRAARARETGGAPKRTGSDSSLSLSISAVGDHDHDHEMEQDDDLAGETLGPRSDTVCWACRIRKLGCNRALPTCSRCEKAGSVCAWAKGSVGAAGALIEHQEMTQEEYFDLREREEAHFPQRLVACDNCRTRKRRCKGGKPGSVCQACQRFGTPCLYEGKGKKPTRSGKGGGRSGAARRSSISSSYSTVSTAAPRVAPVPVPALPKPQAQANFARVTNSPPSVPMPTFTPPYPLVNAVHNQMAAPVIDQEVLRKMDEAAAKLGRPLTPPDAAATGHGQGKGTPIFPTFSSYMEQIRNQAEARTSAYRAYKQQPQPSPSQVPQTIPGAGIAALYNYPPNLLPHGSVSFPSYRTESYAPVGYPGQMAPAPPPPQAAPKQAGPYPPYSNPMHRRSSNPTSSMPPPFSPSPYANLPPPPVANPQFNDPTLPAMPPLLPPPSRNSSGSIAGGRSQLPPLDPFYRSPSSVFSISDAGPPLPHFSSGSLSSGGFTAYTYPRPVDRGFSERMNNNDPPTAAMRVDSGVIGSWDRSGKGLWDEIQLGSGLIRGPSGWMGWNGPMDNVSRNGSSFGVDVADPNAQVNNMGK